MRQMVTATPSYNYSTLPKVSLRDVPQESRNVA